MSARVRTGMMRELGAADDSEDDILSANAAKQNVSKAGPKTTKARQGAKLATKRKAPSKEPRQALKDRTNVPHGDDVDLVQEDGSDAHTTESNPKVKRARTTPSQRDAPAESVNEPANERIPKRPTTKKKGRLPQLDEVPEELAIIPESQTSPEEQVNVEHSIEIDHEVVDDERVLTPKQPQRSAHRSTSTAAQPRARSTSAQPPYPQPRERSASASGTERWGGDPELRRKLNEMTKKYDNIKMKYESLQEVGKDSAETNFERLKRSTDQRAKDANELIASLKKELADLRKQSSSSTAELSTLHKSVASLTKANDQLVKESHDLKEQLHVGQNEIRSLEAKLVAARQQVSSISMEHKVLDAAIRPPARNIITSANEANSQKEAKMKENLYADLTGLLIRGVKRKDGEDEYDCIQTGRNGTMHFHLSIVNDTSTPHPKTPSGLNYEEAEFSYEPLLDEDRDKKLLELLPDYLTEEICFPRNHAQRFYSKVVDSMTKRIVVEE